MKPENLLSSLVAVYPPEGSNVERAGYLPGERAPTADKSPQMVRIFSSHAMLLQPPRTPLPFDTAEGLCVHAGQQVLPDV